MKLLIAIVQSEDADRLIGELVNEGFRVTRIASSGALLRRENASLLLGVEDHQVTRVLSIIRRTCRRRKEVVIPYTPALEPGLLWLPENFEVEVGGATVFVLPVDRVERITGD
ncbi:cyclic-di-AMP receptor [Thermomicrobium sp.]|uniref:cyclic-di-AMP receptor n=1 Tax=Thermomicrobium sp. TaxID=1969469 RepID=UPI001B1B2E33|nr:cyclic-di-AMP receptor [Thermomicrobium sp.]MBO9306042.1 cyclic-di-AMP receptor [Thermomicrobium sp.]